MRASEQADGRESDGGADVLWDLPNGKGDVAELLRLEKKYGVKPGSINPQLFSRRV